MQPISSLQAGWSASKLPGVEIIKKTEMMTMMVVTAIVI